MVGAEERAHGVRARLRWEIGVDLYWNLFVEVQGFGISAWERVLAFVRCFVLHCARECVWDLQRFSVYIYWANIFYISRLPSSF